VRESSHEAIDDRIEVAAEADDAFTGEHPLGKLVDDLFEIGQSAGEIVKIAGKEGMVRFESGGAGLMDDESVRDAEERNRARSNGEIRKETVRSIGLSKRSVGWLHNSPKFPAL
jgi:hypothetical protein